MRYPKHQSLTLIKVLVYFMGFVLVFGTLMVLYIVYKRNHDLFSVDQLTFDQHDKCQNDNIHLQISNEVQTLTLSGSKLVVLSKPLGNSQEMLIVDYCKGNPEKRILFHIFDKVKEEQEDNNEIRSGTPD